MTVISELQRLLALPNLTLEERVALKLALSMLRVQPKLQWTGEEYLELPRKFENPDGTLWLTF